MKKVLSILAFACLTLLGSHLMGQTPGNGGGNAWGYNNNSNGPMVNQGNNGPIPTETVVRICRVAAPQFFVPQGVLIQAYYRGQALIIFDPILNGYFVSYGGNVVVIGIADL